MACRMGAAAGEGVGEAERGDLRGVSYEDSKYLGGDVAHTHLVKGLDFALLQKVRAEQEAGKKGGGAGSDGEGEAPVLAKRVPLGEPEAPATFATPLGRAVHAFFFDPSQRGAGMPVAELFLPRRTAFVYELEEAGAPDIPTTLRRSREDCPKARRRGPPLCAVPLRGGPVPPHSPHRRPAALRDRPQVREMALGGLDGGVLERIAKIMSYMSVQGGGKKKLKRRDREALFQRHGIALQGAVRHPPAPPGGAAAQPGAGAGAAAEAGAEAGLGPEEGPQRPPAAAAAAGEDDDDIFGDAGTDYQPTVKDKARAAAAAAAAEQQQQQQGQARRGGYFGAGAEAELHADLPPLPAE
ncbi:hypothetical protein CHLNCDRAFT_136594, partial [Chlorella variabilis]